MSEVEYRPWPRHPQYLVGSDGSIRGPRGNLLLPQMTHKGYHAIGVWDAEKRYTNKVFVHAAVCETWHGERPAGHQVAHFDGDPTNNRPENLRWATGTENCADRARHGRTSSRVGQANGRALLTEEIVRHVRQEYAAGGTSFAVLAARYGVTVSAISGAVYRQTWRHVL